MVDDVVRVAHQRKRRAGMAGLPARLLAGFPAQGTALAFLLRLFAQSVARGRLMAIVGVFGEAVF
jgi:hypothetical protein